MNNLNIIHVAGTKGKGSTCAFVNSFLKSHGERTGFPRKIGLYTSPHLRCLRERVQIDSKPLSEEMFGKYVFEVWDRLPHHQDSPEPRFLQLLMLVSTYAFIREGVDVAVYETHSGGEFDATNVIQTPVVTGITTIGLDHVEQLGPAIENIAWHKAGIFKTGRPAFSVPQEHGAATVLQDRASEKGIALRFVETNPMLPAGTRALKPDVQKVNASLALALSNTFLQEKAAGEHRNLISTDIHKALEQFFWPGRFHQVPDGIHTWFLDGAHNELSVQNAASWFAGEVMERQRLPLVFHLRMILLS